MKFKPRALLRSIFLLSLAAGSSMPASAAGLVNVNFAGTVNPQVPGFAFPGHVLQGDFISGSFSYNPSQFGNKGSGLYTFSSTSPSSQTLPFQVVTPGFTPATFADEYFTGAYTIQVKDIGSKGATLDIHAVTIFQQSVGPPPVFATVDVLLNSSTYTGLSLPTSTTITSFLSSPGTLTWEPPLLAFTADLFIINGEVVPEPSSLVLAFLATGTGGAGFLFSRRKGVAA
jgi:hypothetical protein